MYDLNQYGELIDEQLEKMLKPTGTAYDEVTRAMHYAVMNGGKRIRPILTLEFCRIHGGRVKDALPYACAAELIHSYSLVHDDLPCMDDDDLRRGKPSCHKQFGESTALLAGDGLLTKAFEIMANAPLAAKNPAAALHCVAILSTYAGVPGMIGGQIMDLAQEGKTVTKEELSEMHLLKTGALIRAACQMGSRVATADFGAQHAAAMFGKHLGLAFQMVDDLLDVVSTEKELGKPIGSDAENDKNTFLTLCGMEEAGRLAEEETKHALRVLEALPDSVFLQELTKQLLIRRN